jgi:hypothetical protein
LPFYFKHCVVIDRFVGAIVPEETHRALHAAQNLAKDSLGNSMRSMVFTFAVARALKLTKSVKVFNSRSDGQKK